MPETKSQVFHRLAAKRVEDIADKIRIFSNLAGPANEFTAAEVIDYVTQIEAALATALNRFKDTKCWRLSASHLPAEVPEIADTPPEIVEHRSDVEDEPDPQPKYRRRSVIAQIIADAKDDPEALAEMVAMQRTVIESLRCGSQKSENVSGK